VEVALQLEATGEPPIWNALAAGELDPWAAGLARIWRRLGLGRGDTLAFFDYGSNPAVLLSTRIFVAHLRRGATDRLGATAICNDGVASMTGRLLGILESVRPSGLFVRRDLVAPLADLLATRGLPQGSRLRWAVIGETEGGAAKAKAEKLESALGVPVRRWLRADAAFFFAADCALCGHFHVDPRLYAVEGEAGGEPLVTARFAVRCPAVRYRLGGRIEAPGCSAEPRAPRIAWP
jgi:phenylacetate-coenzyme A ligase PaaK-like adenylate-forming protein